MKGSLGFPRGSGQDFRRRVPVTVRVEYIKSDVGGHEASITLVDRKGTGVGELALHRFELAALRPGDRTRHWRSKPIPIDRGEIARVAASIRLSIDGDFLDQQALPNRWISSSP